MMYLFTLFQVLVLGLLVTLGFVMAVMAVAYLYFHFVAPFFGRGRV